MMTWNGKSTAKAKKEASADVDEMIFDSGSCFKRHDQKALDRVEMAESLRAVGAGSISFC